MLNYTHEDLELLYMLADGCDGEDADPGATQELRDLEGQGHTCPGPCCNTALISAAAHLKDNPHTLTRRNYNV